MDFGALPPEINSARMYSGAGSEPLLSAAAAWNGLAADLRSTAASYASVIEGLATQSWLGPASAAMAAAAAPYATWMNITAAQAEQTGAQAGAAADAYEAAFAATVPPPLVAANRTQLASLVATNVLGQNTPAIAANEAAYGEMWAQDAAAMYGYAANSAAASQVPQFTAPQQTVNPAGQASQATAVAQTTGTATSSATQSTLSQVMSAVPNTLQGLASPAASTSGVSSSLSSSNPFSAGTSTATTGISGLLNSLDGNTSSAFGSFLNSTLMNGFFSAGYISPALISPAVTSALGDIGFLTLLEGGAAGLDPSILISAAGPAGALGLGHAASAMGPLSSAVSAGMGRATLVGAFSVPQSWAAATPAPTAPLSAFPAPGFTNTPQVTAGAMQGMPGMPGMSMAGSGGRGFGFSAPRYGFRPTVMAQPPAAG